MNFNKPVMGISVGDPAGIGPEIVVKALLNHPVADQVIPVVFADKAVLLQAADICHLPVQLKEVKDIKDVEDNKEIIHYVSSGRLNDPVEMGRISAECGQATYAYYNAAIDWALEGKVDAVATAPLQKEALKAGGSPELDHTNILKARVKSDEITTLFVVDNLRIFFLTRHIPLREVGDAITKEMIVTASRRCLQFLKQLGLEDPQLAVAGLNPHNGDHGMFGTEEIETIIPAVKEANAAGLKVVGPIPGDSVFHLGKEGHFDGVLSLYHDQGHIAIKTMDFYRTVSLTMGAPFLRSSVDHGTAFGIAGQGIANETSMIEAILVGAKYAKQIRETDYRTL